MTNAEIVRLFTEEVFNKNHPELIDQFMREDYIQHNPTVRQGRDGFKEFQKRFCSQSPNLHLYIKHLYECGDIVISHNLAVIEPGVNENIVVDIYRLEDGKLAEHWDCIQHLTEEQIKNTDALY